MSSSLRGAKIQANSKQGQRRLDAFELKFEAVIPTKCFSASCQTNTLVAFGSESPFLDINECFATSVDDGALALRLKEVGDQMNLRDYLGTYPGATNGVLTYVNAIASQRDGITWSPSEIPTYHPTYVTQEPTADVYWPDAMNTVCRAGEGYPRSNTNFFGRIEDCCEFPWIDDYDECMTNSFEANKPTRRPTREPTPKPTRRPTPRPTRGLPDDSPNLQPTGPGGPTGPTAPRVVYYPDLTLGVCKFDGRHGNTPYQFSTAEACCTNQWMDKEKCMAYADPYYSAGTRFYPDIYAGYCKSDGAHVGLDERMVFGSAAACCDNVWMVYTECMSKSANPPSTPTGPTTPTYSDPNTPRPTPRPTPHPTQPVDATQVRGVFYPDFNSGLCLSDGNHQGQMYTFDTLAQCCTNGVMNYGDCVASSMAVYDPNSGSNSVGGGSGNTNTHDTSDCKWYPDPSSFGVCTYSENYPADWAGKPDHLFNSHEDCCVGAFGGPGCDQTYNCNGERSGPTPTGFVTLEPTSPYPTWNPIGNEVTPDAPDPTPPPTPKATPPPTKGSPPGPPVNPRDPSTYSRRPTKAPVKFALPPGITTAIDATTIGYEIKDSFENGLSTDFPWHTSDPLPWVLREDDVADGKFAAWSAEDIQPGDTSDLQMAIQSKHGGTLYFDFKTDVRMPFTGSYMNVDGESRKGYTYPKEAWLDTALSIDGGEHVVMFRAWAPDMARPDRDPGASGRIGLDNVSFMPALFAGFEDKELDMDGMEVDGDDWKFDLTKAKSGEVSLKSPDLSQGQTSKLKFELSVPRRGSDISFWYYSEVEMPSDMFMFKINGKTVLNVSKSRGEWQQFTNSIPPGRTYNLEWEYSKRGGGSGGGIRIDDIDIRGKT